MVRLSPAARPNTRAAIFADFFEDASALALPDLVRYVARCCAEKPNRPSLYEMAQKYDWEAGDVLAFLRCQQKPSMKMLRELCRELDIRSDYAVELLRR